MIDRLFIWYVYLTVTTLSTQLGMNPGRMQTPPFIERHKCWIYSHIFQILDPRHRAW